MKSPEPTVDRRGRAWLAAACVGYGAWLVLLVVLAVIQKAR